MSDETTGAGAAGQTETIARSAAGDAPLSAREAALSLVDTRRKDAAGQRRDDDQQDSGEARDEAPASRSAERDGATADTRSAEEAGTAQETGPGETQEASAEAGELPPIAPPRSWTKEDKELFGHLPRETQERLADRERSREADFLRRQNEAAEKSKSLTAREQAAEQVRTHYEQMLPALLLALQGQHAGEFADIKTLDDVSRLARDDWPRFALFQAHQMKVAGLQKEIEAAGQRLAQETQARLASYRQEQNALFAEKAPEFADPKTKAAASEAAVTMLHELGWSHDDLGRLWRGEADISLHDHRLQLLIRDGVRYREAQAKAKAAQQRSVPHVQRPGPAPARGADADERVKSLDDRLTTSGTLRDAAALLMAQRQARARR